METVMILGAGPLQVPAIMKAKELNMKVVVCDFDANAIGRNIADEFYLISTIDKERVLNKAIELAPDYVITSTSDAPVRTAAYVSEKLGLPTGISYENAICATVKSAMRDRLKKKNIPIPEYFVCATVEEFLEAVRSFANECILKPSDSSASRGVKKLDCSLSVDKLVESYRECCKYSNNGVVLVEELMHGAEVSVECIIVNQKIHIIAITDKYVTEEPYFVELGHSEQSQLDDKIKSEIEMVTKKAIEAIDIVNGVAHAELKITKDGPKIVEIAARLGGDYITSRLVPLSTGVDMVGNSICLALNKPFKIEKKLNKGSAIRFIRGTEGKIKKINFNDDLYDAEGLVELKVYCKEGDICHDLKSSNDRLGHIITQADNAEMAIKIAEAVLSKIEIIIEKV